MCCCLLLLLCLLQTALTAANFERVFAHLMGLLLTQFETLLLTKRVNAVGARQLECDVRALRAHALQLAQRAVRDRFARLTQIVALLNVRSLDEVEAFWCDPNVSSTLTPSECRRVLALRVDFHKSRIKELVFGS